MGPFDNWFLSLFLDDPDLNFRVHLRVELNWDVVDSEGSDRFIELYCASIALQTLFVEQVDDLLGRDGPEDAILFPHGHRNVYRSLA